MIIDDRSRRNFFALDSMFFIRAGIVLLSSLLLAVAVSRVVYPFDAGNVETLSWVPAEHLLAGENPYSFAFVPPYSMAPYGIVYYALLAVGVKLFGLQIWFGRILSVCGFAICLLSAAKTTRKLTDGNKAAIMVACITGMAMFPMQMWIALMRADLIAAGFAAAALGLAFTFDEKNKLTVGRTAAIVLLAALAFFTKHTFSLPAVFIFLRFWQIGERRAAFFFAAAFATLLTAGTFLLDYTSSGGYVWQHFVHARQLPFIFGDLATHFPGNAKLPAFLFFLFFLLTSLFQKRRMLEVRDGKPKRSLVLHLLRSPKLLILIYFAISLCVAFASSGRVGANVNYYIENSFLTMILCALVYDWFRRYKSVKLSFALVVLLTFGGAFQLARIARGEYFRWQTLDYYREIFERAGEITAQNPDGVCVSVSPELVMRNGCVLEYDDLGEYDGGWAPELKAIFEREINAGRYTAIVWSSDDLQARFPNYRLVPTQHNAPSRFFPVFLYERVERADVPTP